MKSNIVKEAYKALAEGSQLQRDTVRNLAAIAKLDTAVKPSMLELLAGSYESAFVQTSDNELIVGVALHEREIKWTPLPKVAWKQLVSHVHAYDENGLLQQCSTTVRVGNAYLFHSRNYAQREELPPAMPPGFDPSLN